MDLPVVASHYDYWIFPAYRLILGSGLIIGARAPQPFPPDPARRSGELPMRLEKLNHSWGFANSAC
jgi:hypothetical protein